MTNHMGCILLGENMNLADVVFGNTTAMKVDIMFERFKEEYAAFHLELAENNINAYKGIVVRDLTWHDRTP
jgi:hypothetical protein